MLPEAHVDGDRRAQEAAEAFCRKHGLPDAIVAPLAAHIQENLDSALADARSEGSCAADGSQNERDGLQVSRGGQPS